MKMSWEEFVKKVIENKLYSTSAAETGKTPVALNVMLSKKNLKKWIKVFGLDEKTELTDMILVIGYAGGERTNRGGKIYRFKFEKKEFEKKTRYSNERRSCHH